MAMITATLVRASVRVAGVARGGEGRAMRAGRDAAERCGFSRTARATVVARSTPTQREIEDEIEERDRRKARESVLGQEKDVDVKIPGEDGVPLAKEFDIYRDSPLRYMGYANECGEAFVAWLPAWGVPATYGVAATYVLADTVDKGLKRWKQAEGDDDRLNQAVGVATETVTWQMLASVFWPGSFIRVVVASTNLALAKADTSAFEALAAQGIDVEKILPTLFGLAAIPFIVKPIDTTVDAAGEVSFGKAIQGKMEGASDWAVGAAVMAACLAVPPTLFSLAGFINDAAGVVPLE